MFSSNYVESSIPQTREEWIAALQEEFKFTAEDYAANQRGQYSDVQRAELEPITTRMRNDPSCFIVLAGALLVGVVGLIVLNAALNGLIVAFLSIYPYGVMAGLAALGGVCVMIISAFSTMHIRSTLNSMDKFVIRGTQGPATVQRSWSDHISQPTTPLIRSHDIPSLRGHRSRRGIHYYRVEVGGQTFYMLQPSAERFLPGGVYRIFYVRVPYGGVYLLSAELLQMP